MRFINGCSHCCDFAVPGPVPGFRRLSMACAMLAIALAMALGLQGCRFVENVTGETARKQARAEEAKQKSQVLQQKVMRFADQYVERTTQRIDQLAAGFVDVDVRADLFGWRFAHATSAVQIAAGPNPVTNAVDMVVMVSLSRRKVESLWVGRYGEQAMPVLASCRALEEEAWRLLDGIGTEQQIAELRMLLDAWTAENPDLESVAFIRFDNFAGAGAGASSRVRASSSLLGIVGLDPMKGIDPAVREVEQTRLLAERAVYYAQRLPILLDLQASLIGARTAATPELQQLTAAVDRAGQLSLSLARLVDDAPGLISREREAAIAQFMGELQRQQDDMLALATQMRAALEAGAVTAESLEALVQSADQLASRFKSASGAEPPGPAGRPFDINEYTRAVTELADTARELQKLVGGVDGLTPRLSAQAEVLSGQAKELVDYAFWRLLALVLAVLLAAVGYRFVASRFSRTRGTDTTG